MKGREEKGEEERRGYERALSSLPVPWRGGTEERRKRDGKGSVTYISHIVPHVYK